PSDVPAGTVKLPVKELPEVMVEALSAINSSVSNSPLLFQSIQTFTPPLYLPTPTVMPTTASAGEEALIDVKLLYPFAPQLEVPVSLAIFNMASDVVTLLILAPLEQP